MSITQNKIAEHLGISRVSVARALNGHGKVSPESRRRIEEAARELGYDSHTNRAAREMIARRYGTLIAPTRKVRKTTAMLRSGCSLLTVVPRECVRRPGR